MSIRAVGIPNFCDSPDSKRPFLFASNRPRTLAVNQVPLPPRRHHCDWSRSCSLSSRDDVRLLLEARQADFPNCSVAPDNSRRRAYRCPNSNRLKRLSLSRSISNGLRWVHRDLAASARSMKPSSLPSYRLIVRSASSKSSWVYGYLITGSPNSGTNATPSTAPKGFILFSPSGRTSRPETPLRNAE